MSTMVEIEYDRYGRKEKKWYVMCQTREDLEAVYDRYEFSGKDKKDDIDWAVKNHKFPILIAPPLDTWSRCRFFNSVYEMDEYRKITKEIALPTLCVEVE